MPFVAINLWCLIIRLSTGETGLAQLVEHWSPNQVSGVRVSQPVQNKNSYEYSFIYKGIFFRIKDHVSWTAIPELSNLTVVVLVFSLIFAGLIWLADSVLSRIVKLYFDL